MRRSLRDGCRPAGEIDVLPSASRPVKRAGLPIEERRPVLEQPQRPAGAARGTSGGSWRSAASMVRSAVGVAKRGIAGVAGVGDALGDGVRMRASRGRRGRAVAGARRAPPRTPPAAARSRASASSAADIRRDAGSRGASRPARSVTRADREQGVRRRGARHTGGACRCALDRPGFSGEEAVERRRQLAPIGQRRRRGARGRPS